MVFTSPYIKIWWVSFIFFLFFIPISIFLEKYSKDKENLNSKIMVVLMITALVFLGRNVSRLIKEYRIYYYQPFISINYPLNKSSFRIKTLMRDKINNDKAKKIYKNRYNFRSN